MNRIRSGDQVIVIAGKDKGKVGEVIRMDGERVFVSNVNMVKKHVKANPQANQVGGIQEREASIHLSNVMPVNPATGRGERIGVKRLEDGKKIRVYRSNGEALDS